MKEELNKEYDSSSIQVLEGLEAVIYKVKNGKVTKKGTKKNGRRESNRKL